MGIKRYDITAIMSDDHPCLRIAPTDEGGWTIHSDHAAELARVEDDLLKMNNLAYEWRVRAERAEAYVDNQWVHSDFRTATEMRAALDHYRDDLTATRAELARVVAECERREKEGVSALAAMTAERDALKDDVSMRSREVFRESQLRRKIEEMMKEHAEYLRDNRMLDDKARAVVEGGR